MKYFTTDTHFGHPLVSVLRGFTTFDPGHTQYDALLSSQGRKAAEDWAKGVVLDDSRLNFRKAADTDAHDEAIVANINRIVGEDDELWIFGRYRIPNIGPASEELPASAALQASARGYRQSR